ncbi:MAG TPA: glycosyltransferase, partial [Bacillota bacterium]|nr:glycosyltransferase [Bacillota bacterium]
MRVILSGGGTGGHIYPAVSIAKEIKNLYNDSEILFIGTEKGLESSIVPKEGLKLIKIKIR